MAENKQPFKISAAVVKQLGEELVSDEVTAIMELVKNSYDADADWVKITINTIEKLEESNLTFNANTGYIIIEDNGDGMNYKDITDQWLFISVSHKRQMKIEGKITEKKRTPLGDKGLGRLSTQRLGSVLEMFTGRINEDQRHHVAFDWKDFTENASLETVNTNYSNFSKPIEEKGTRLIITDLREAGIWKGEAGDKFRGQLSQLIFPFKNKRPFSVYLTINGVKQDLDEINETLRRQAITSYNFDFRKDDKTGKSKLVVKGKVKLSKLEGNTQEKKEIFQKLLLIDHGRNFFDYLTNPLDNKRNFLNDIKYSGEEGIFFSFEREFDFEKDISRKESFLNHEGELEVANPGDFLGEIDEFYLSGNEEIESAFDSISEYKQLVKNQVGVRIFRDGFGIKPYGMGGEDWLKLSKGQTSGSSFYGLRPENVVGFVSITAEKNKHLVEKTDREGFIDSPYSRNFLSLISIIVSNINEVLEKTRRSYDEFKKSQSAIKGNINSFKDTKERLLNTAKESQEIEADAERIFRELKSISTTVNTTVKVLNNHPLFNTEQAKNALKDLEGVDSILNQANKAFEKISAILESSKKLEHDVYYLEPKIEDLENQLHQFSELAGLGITAEAFTHEMYNGIDRMSNQTNNVVKQLKKDGISNPAIFIYVENVKSFIVSIRKQLNHLAPSLKFNREPKQEISLFSFCNEMKVYYQERFNGKILFTLEEKNDLIVNMNKGKLTQILDNIILNSEYWLKEANKTDSDFKPEINIEINNPVVRIYDNGFGIAPTMEERLFQPFVTSKPKGIGRGLGLFIVQQLIDSLGCDIILLNKRNIHQRKYIFQINFQSLLS